MAENGSEGRTEGVSLAPYSYADDLRRSLRHYLLAGHIVSVYAGVIIWVAEPLYVSRPYAAIMMTLAETVGIFSFTVLGMAMGWRFDMRTWRMLVKARRAAELNAFVAAIDARGGGPTDEELRLISRELGRL